MDKNPAFADIIEVAFEKGSSGAYFASSKDLKGLLVAKMSLDEARTEVPEAIKEMYQANGRDVIVTAVREDAWVAFPSCVAREQLAA